jgi:Flp pilus assembly protein TadG
MNRIKTQLRRLTKSERGASLVEFALVAPLLFVVLFGMIDFGKGIAYWIDQTHLANEAARFAAVNRNPGATATPATSLQQYTQLQAASGELRDGGTASVPTAGKANVCITFPSGTSNVGDPVRVTVTSTYNWMPILNLTTTQITINAESTMQLEANPTAYSTGCSS